MPQSLSQVISDCGGVDEALFQSEIVVRVRLSWGFTPGYYEPGRWPENT